MGKRSPQLTGIFVHRAVSGLLFLQLCAGVFDVGVALFALFMADRGASPRELGWVLGLGWAAAGAGSLVGGYAADFWGARQGVLAATVLVALGLLGEALAPNWLLAGAGYLLVQAAQAASYPGILRCLDTAAGNRVGSVVGFLHTSYSAVGIPGALLAGWLAEQWGWGAVFGAKAGLYLVACGVLFALLPEDGGTSPTRPEREPCLWLPLLRHSALRYACGAVIVITLCGYAGSFYPYDLRARFGLGPAALSRFPAIYNAVWLLSNWPAGLVGDRWGRKRVVVLGFGLMAAAWAFFPWAKTVTFLYFLYALYCLGNSLGYYTTLVAMEAVPDAARGRAVGLLNTCMQGGAALGEAAGGTLWLVLGAPASYTLAALGSAAGALLLARVRTLPAGPAQPQLPREQYDASQEHPDHR